MFSGDPTKQGDRDECAECEHARSAHSSTCIVKFASNWTRCQCKGFAEVSQ